MKKNDPINTSENHAPKEYIDYLINSFKNNNMKDEVKKFLDSGILEEYLTGTCDEEKIARVEHCIETHPEIKAEYENLKGHIEKMAQKLDSESPKGIEAAIISCLEEDSQYKLKKDFSRKPRRQSTFIPWAAAVIGLIATIALFNQKQQLTSANMEVYAQKNMAESQLEASQEEVKILKDKLALSGHSKTERILLTGNNLSPGFNSTAFWNDVAGKAIIYVNDLGKIDNDHCYQIWADVDGKMINIGVLPQNTGPISINHLKNVTSINITIEPEGGSDHPNVEMLVSSHGLEKI